MTGRYADERLSVSLHKAEKLFCLKIFNFFEDFQQKGLFFMAKFTIVCYNKMYRFMTIQILAVDRKTG
jgi:hypothetical protein